MEGIVKTIKHSDFATVIPGMSQREVYRLVFSHLRQVYGTYDAYDCLALDRVQTFNFFARLSSSYDPVDAAFRSWEACGVHRPVHTTTWVIAQRRALHYRQLAINA